MIPTLGAFLSAIAGPLAKRVLTALGIGVVSFIGVSLSLDVLLTQAKTAWSGMSADVAVYMAMCGANTAMSIIAGALTARVGLASLKKLTLL